MKNILLILVFTVFALSADAQQPGIRNDTAFYYCELLAMDRALGTMKSYCANFGEESQFFTKYPDLNHGKFKNFLSSSLPLNILAADGWQLVAAYRTVTVKEPGDCFILCKRR